jgi:hypothetical protein
MCPINGGEALAREVGAGSLYVPTDCMDEDAIAKAVKATIDDATTASHAALAGIGANYQLCSTSWTTPVFHSDQYVNQ